MGNVLIKDCTIVPMVKDLFDEGGFYFQGDIAIEGSIIKAVGDMGQIDDQWQADKVIDGTGKVALPGFINCHTHGAMTLLRSYADDLPLMQWLEKKIWPLESKLEAEDVYWGSMLCILEMIKSGTTTFADMYFFMDQVAQAVSITGIRADLARGLIGITPRSEQSLEEAEALVRQWHNNAGGRITVRLGPHAPYTCPPAFLEKVMQLAADLNVGIHIHLAETKNELDSINSQYGKSPIQLMADLGVFQFPTLAAHCVHVSKEDIDIMARQRVGVAHNPESNMKLASGIAPVPQMIAAGVNVGLGTDGAASNNNLDMLEEMRTAALLHKVQTMDPTVLSSYQALLMATRNGAKVLGLEDIIGQLKPGMKADLILINMQQPHLYPCHDVLAHLVYAAQASDVQTVLIDGKIVMEDRHLTTINEQEVMNEIANRARRLVSDI